jgi:hypothetical protein
VERGHKVTDQPVDDVFAAAVKHREAQIANWDKWVAQTDILTPDGVLAFRAGTPVPVEHVEKFGWDKSDPPLVLSREEALKTEGLNVEVVPAVDSQEAIMDALTKPEQGAAAESVVTPKGNDTKPSTSRNKPS